MLLFPAASINPLSSIPSLHSVLPPPLPAFCLFSGILSNASRTSLLPVSAASNSPTYNYLIQRYSITISNAFSSARLHFTIFSLWFCINTPSPLSLWPECVDMEKKCTSFSQCLSLQGFCVCVLHRPRGICSSQHSKLQLLHHVKVK